MGYIIIRVQEDGIQGYDEDKIVLVIPDLSNFMAWVPVILGTPTISHIMNVIKEREIDALATPWVNALVAYLLAVWQATATVDDDIVAAGVLNLTGYDEMVTTKFTKMIDAFLSHIIHARTRTAYTGARLQVIIQALHAEDRSLPQGLTILKSYTKMCNGSKNVAIVVRNSMAYPQTLRKKPPVARTIAVTWVPEPPLQAGMTALDEAQGLQMPKLTAKERQEKLFEKLELSGLESWPLKLADSVWSLLPEYHDIFSLEPS